MLKNHALIIAASAAIASTAIASDPQFVLSDRNSTATFDVNNGQIAWEVDGVSQLFAQEFYFRRAFDTREHLLSAANLSLDGILTTDTNPFRDDSDDSLSQLYSDDAGLQIETVFTLRGGSDGSSRADLAEQIIIRNLSQESMSISFFQFVDFDLGGDAAGDAGQIVSGNTVSQSDDGFFVSETVVTPQPNYFQVGDADEISGMLNDESVDSLDNTASYAGNVGWSFQWDITLAAGQSFIITKDKSVVPAPGSFALLGLAGAIVTRRRR